jgi:prepilin-type processing-associated H-X9-DG protein
MGWAVRVKNWAWAKRRPLLAGLAAALAALALAGVLRPVWLPGDTGRRARCAAHLRTLGRALSAYADDHTGLLPPCAKINEVEYEHLQLYVILETYVPSPDVFRCPSDVGAPDTAGRSGFMFYGSSYQNYALSDAQRRGLPFPTPRDQLLAKPGDEATFARDAVAWHGLLRPGTFNLLYADGHVAPSHAPSDGGVE